MIKPDDNEKKVKQEVKKALNDLEVYWFMPPANGYGRSGIPDFVVCADGHFIGVECKAPSRKDNVSELQKREGAKIVTHGGAWILVYDDETLNQLRSYILIQNIGRE